MLETLQFIGGVPYYKHLTAWFGGWLPQIQLGRFRRLLAFAQRRSPYLREKYRGINARQDMPGEVPPMTKAEMMSHFNDIVTDRRIRRKEVEGFTAYFANVGRLFLDRY